MSELEGEEITDARMIDDASIVFGTASGKTVFWSACGDCCSRSYFQHIEGLDALRGKTVLRVDLGLDEFGLQTEASTTKIDDRDHGYNTQKRYSYAIETGSGRCVFDMRNDSNGYYSGWIAESTHGFLDQYDRARAAGKDLFADGDF